jgi:hypothetical protein
MKGVFFDAYRSASFSKKVTIATEAQQHYFCIFLHSTAVIIMNTQPGALQFVPVLPARQKSTYLCKNFLYAVSFTRSG